MDKIGGAVILFFIALFAYTKLAGPIPFTVTQVTTNKTDTFSVTGEGKVSMPPDIAVVNAGVQARGATVKAAQDQLNKSISAVSAAVKSKGVDAKDVQTSSYTINPTIDYRSGDSKITGYEASSNLTIKVRAIDTANAVIDAATGAGATNLSGISFDVDDKTNAQNEARKKAVDAAKKKAENAAKIAGFKLGRIVNYSEDFGGFPRPIPMMEKADTALTAGTPTQVEIGTNEVSVTVTLSYQIQ